MAVAAVGAPHGGLGDPDVLVGEGGHLRQVGHHEDLDVPGQHRQPAADLDGGAAADAGVDLVEDEGRDGVDGGQHHLDGEHDAGEFTAGGALAQRPGRGAGVRLEQEGDLVRAERSQLARGLHVDDQGGVGHGQGRQLRADPGGEVLGGLGARPC